MTLNIYTEDFDESDSISDGFCGDVFVDGGSDGMSFRDGSLSENLTSALEKISGNVPGIDGILFCYRSGGEQRFVRFSVSGSA